MWLGCNNWLTRATKSSDEADGRELHDPVRMYLSQMGSIPLLTREQEIRLAKTIDHQLLLLLHMVE